MSEQREPSAKLMKHLALVIELCGATLTPAAIRAMGAELAVYPEEAVLAALERCKREVTGRLSLAHIIQRIDDGRPTADEAWAQVGTDDEYQTLVTTDEALQAVGEVRTLIEAGDMVAARKSFLDAYQRIVTENRARGVPVNWLASLGWDNAGQIRALTAAVQAGKLSAAYCEQRTGIPAAQFLGRAQPSSLPGESPRHAAPALPPGPVAQLVGGLAASKGPPPCGAEGCDGWTHGENGPRCPQWGL